MTSASVGGVPASFECTSAAPLLCSAVGLVRSDRLVRSDWRATAGTKRVPRENIGADVGWSARRTRSPRVSSAHDGAYRRAVKNSLIPSPKRCAARKTAAAAARSCVPMPRMAAAVPRLDDAQLRGLVGLAIFKFNLSHSGLKFGSTYINVNGQDANLFLFLCGSFAAGYQFLSKPFSAEAVREYFVSHALEYVVMYYVGLFAFAAVTSDASWL